MHSDITYIYIQIDYYLLLKQNKKTIEICFRQQCCKNLFGVSRDRTHSLFWELQLKPGTFDYSTTLNFSILL